MLVTTRLGDLIKCHESNVVEIKLACLSVWSLKDTYPLIISKWKSENKAGRTKWIEDNFKTFHFREQVINSRFIDLVKDVAGVYYDKENNSIDMREHLHEENRKQFDRQIDIWDGIYSPRTVKPDFNVLADTILSEDLYSYDENQYFI